MTATTPEAVEAKTPLRIKVLGRLWCMDWVSWEILKEITTRYSARIGELKKMGFDIESRPLAEDGLQGKEYRLISREPGELEQYKARVDLTTLEASLLLTQPLPGVVGYKVKESLARAKQNEASIREQRRSDLETLAALGFMGDEAP